MRLLKCLAVAVLTFMWGATCANAATVAFVGGTIIDGTGRAPIADGVLVATDGKVTAVGPRASVTIPGGAQRIDVTGKTIMPGLVNAHGHLSSSNNAGTPTRTQYTDQLALYARYGVTTLYSLGDDGAESLKLRDELSKTAADARPGLARIYSAGLIVEPKDAAEARALVSENAKRGADIIKMRIEGANTPSRQPAVYGALISQAHADKLRITAHMFTAEEARGLVDAGIDSLAHSIRDRDADSALIAAMRAKGVGYIPTLTRDLSVFVYESTPAFADDPFFAREAYYSARFAALTAPEAQARVRANAGAQASKAALTQAKRNLKILADAGVPIAMGTDSGAAAGRWQGYFEHLELELMVESGLTPMQTLVAATGGAARVMRIEDVVGTLQPGRYADLLVLAANPLSNIRNTRTLEQVWIGGKKAN